MDIEIDIWKLKPTFSAVVETREFFFFARTLKHQEYIVESANLGVLFVLDVF